MWRLDDEAEVEPEPEVEPEVEAYVAQFVAGISCILRECNKYQPTGRPLIDPLKESLRRSPKDPSHDPSRPKWHRRDFPHFNLFNILRDFSGFIYFLVFSE